MSSNEHNSRNSDLCLHTLYFQVILIHLSNLTGMKNDYNKRTMALLVSDIGCIVWGTTAAMSTGFIKVGGATQPNPRPSKT